AQGLVVVAGQAARMESNDLGRSCRVAAPGAAGRWRLTPAHEGSYWSWLVCGTHGNRSDAGQLGRVRCGDLHLASGEGVGVKVNPARRWAASRLGGSSKVDTLKYGSRRSPRTLLHGSRRDGFPKVSST